MRNYSLIFIFAITLISLNTNSFAESTKIIKLKDGSVLNGKVIEFYDGVYTFETSNLGNIKIPEADVLSISSPEAYGISTQQTTTSKEAQKALLKNQVQQMQGSIMADQEIKADLQKLAEDDDIKAMLLDPNLLSDVMSFDQEKIQQSDAVQKLMKNPKIQQLMIDIQQKMSTQ